jgi:hypothetical protein
LQRHRYPLVHDLRRFLELAELWGGESEALTLTPEDAEYYQQELLLRKYLRGLLRTRHLRLLGDCARALDLDLRLWLPRDRTAVHVTPDDLPEALAAVLRQYGLPTPPAPPPEREGATWLLGHLEAAGCGEWAAVLALALQDHVSLTRIARASPALAKTLRTLTPNPGPGAELWRAFAPLLAGLP